MILPDFEIEHLCEQYDMVTPYERDLLNPASLDVRLGAQLLVEVSHRPDLQPLSIASTTEVEPYLLYPGAFVLAHTIEQFNIPEDICSRFMLKSSRAREGLEHLLAGFADPGFHGSSMTLELTNARRHHPIPLWYGMRVGQMVFEMLSAKPLRSYAKTGRYNNTPSVTPSKG